jgi:hypothetical protein
VIRVMAQQKLIVAKHWGASSGPNFWCSYSTPGVGTRSLLAYCLPPLFIQWTFMYLYAVVGGGEGGRDICSSEIVVNRNYCGIPLVVV